MSFIYRDFLSPSRMIYNMHMGLFRSFQGAFPIETIDGVEVYKDQLNLYNNGVITEWSKAKRFMNKLGMEYSTLQEQDYNGIKRLYFSFDSKKYNYESLTNLELLNDLQLRFNEGDVFSLKITYGGKSLRYFKDHDLYVNDIGLFVAKLDSDKKLYYGGVEPLIEDTDNYSSIKFNTQSKTSSVHPISIKTEGEDWESFALLDNGTYFERTNVRSVQRKTSSTKVDGKLVDELSFVFDYKCIKQPDNENSVLVNNMKDISDIIETATINKQPYALSSNTLIKSSLIELQPYDNTLFYGNALRVSAVQNMKKKDFSELLGRIIRISHTEKEVPWYKKALMVIVVIAAVFISIVTGGLAAPGAAALTGWAMASAIGITLGILSASLTIGLYAVSQVGPDSNLGSWGRFIGKVAQISGYAAAIIGAMAAVQAAMSTLIKSGLDMTVKQGMSAVNAIKNGYSVVDNLTASEDPIEDDTEDMSMVTAGDILSYQEMTSELDALTHVNMNMEKILGGNMTQAKITNQTR